MSNESLDRHYVTAVPLSDNIRKDFPRVSGTLIVSPEEFMGDSYNVFSVVCKYDDGDECLVEVNENGIREANSRRSPETVMPAPGGKS